MINLIDVYKLNSNELEENNIKEKPSIEEVLKPTTRRTRLDSRGSKEYDYEREFLNPTLNETQVVLQSTFSCAGKDLNKRYIETIGAGPCVIVTLYDTENHNGAMAHLDSRSDVLKALEIMAQKINHNKSSLEVRIIGGHIQERSSRQIISSISGFALRTGNKIVEEDILSDEDSKSVVLDTETGKLYNLPDNYVNKFSKIQLDKYINKMEEIQNDYELDMGKTIYLDQKDFSL